MFSLTKLAAAWRQAFGPLHLQHDYNVANDTGSAVRADINNLAQAIATVNSGATAPSTTFAYQLWADTTAGLLKQRNAANTAWLVRGSLAETFVLSRSSNTILGVGDFARVINATAGFTQTFTAAATLADGWFVFYKNNSSSNVTLDPNASEQIDGATTLVMAPGESCIIWCNGSAFFTIGLNKINSLGADATPDGTADYVGTFDASAAVLKKVLLHDLFKTINGLTEDTAPDFAADFLVTYDASGSVAKKVLLGRAAGATATAEIATTSGTSHDFTSLPSWASVIVGMFDAVSTNGTSQVIVQLGDSGGVETTGYTATADTADFTTGFAVDATGNAAHSRNGFVVLVRMDATNNTWLCMGIIRNGAGATTRVAGIKSLSATLDRVRFTTVNGTDAFDAGAVALLYW